MPELPHVTGILKTVGMIDTRFYTEAARDFGTKLHLATQILDEGRLDWKDLDPRLLPRVRQYQDFLRQVDVRILAIEERVENIPLQYQGRLDRRVFIIDSYYPQGREGVLDIKPPNKERWHPIQLSMYANCFDRPMARWSLHLHDERYQLIEHRGRRDWEVAKAAMTLAAWKEKPDA